MTWGYSSSGGDSVDVQGDLQNVQSIAASSSAFAALKEGGTVVTWGSSDVGGDSEVVDNQLTNIVRIHGAHGTFVALKGVPATVDTDLTAADDILASGRELLATTTTDYEAAQADAGNKVTLRVLERFYPDKVLHTPAGTIGNKSVTLNYQLQRSSDLKSWSTEAADESLVLSVPDDETYYYLE